MTTDKKKPRKSGIPTGNAGEYFVMGELLRRGYDAQLADRNTKGYDILIGQPDDIYMRKLQVKSVRTAPWYVKAENYAGVPRDQITIFVLLGKETAQKPVRYFITRNSEIAANMHFPSNWKENAFMPLHAIEKHEDKWDILVS